MSWPDDADGDVFRRLKADLFDFSLPHEVEFNVDFDSWPPPAQAVSWLEQRFGEVRFYQSARDGGGYVQFKVMAPVTYELVTTTQTSVSLELGRYGGICESWGVLN